MLVELKKYGDGSATLRCLRAAAEPTWKRYHGRQAGFYWRHDLMHFAVETELGFSDGFFGLLEQGWQIEDTDGKGTRGAPPRESVVVEHVVSLFAMELAGVFFDSSSFSLPRSPGEGWGALSAPQFNEQLASFLSDRGLPPARSFDEAEIERTRSRIRDLFQRRHALAPGATLQLEYTTHTEALAHR